MQPKFKVGDMAKVLRGECVVQLPGKRIVYDCKNVVGRVGRVECKSVRFEGSNDYVESAPIYGVHVHIEGVPRTIEVKEEDLTTVTLGELADYFDVACVDYDVYTGKIFMKLNKKADAPKREHIVFCGGRNYGKSCLQEIIEDLSKLNESAKESRLNIKRLSEDTAQELINRINAIRSQVCANMSESESKPEGKMPKQRCIKLLEAYRAEREKVAKGRKFERCLRDGVVNEAIERAIELLKEGGE